MRSEQESRKKRRAKIPVWLVWILSLTLGLSACGTAKPAPQEAPATESSVPDAAAAEGAEAAAPAEKNGEIYILYTSDIHCGIERGFGFAGLQQVRDTLEAQGYTTILVDDGDAIQGEPIGTLSEGKAMIELMNALHYDAAIPGNHEFDYGTERFLELAKLAEFPYISCNFNRMGDLLFDPYVILEAEGLKIAFVGVTTPQTIGSSTPVHFQNEAGELVYGFLSDKTGESLYAAVQSAVDDARAAGADLVYVMGHCGMEEDDHPWTYADIIEHTRGIDVFLDGHSHDTEQVVMKNLDGQSVARSACGTKLSCIGYSHISAEGEVLETGIWTWNNKVGAPALLGIDNAAGAKVREALAALQDQLGEVVAYTPWQLTVNDPEAVDSSGFPIRMVRRAETNLGDLCADAFRDQGQADVAFINGGGVRTEVETGDITYGDVLSVLPFGNILCVIEVSGQDILDALEWGVRSVPKENGNFPQVSGLSFTVDVSVESPCIADEDDMFVAIQGARRVKDVLVGGEPIDPEKTYTLAGHDHMLLQIADGYAMFRDAPVLQSAIEPESQALINYIRDTLGGVIGEEYADPRGQGRIVMLRPEHP